MKITDIKRQVRRAGRYSIFVDGIYAFSLGESALLRSGLFMGKEIGDDELASLKLLAAEDKALDGVLNLISRRMRSEWEVRDYLKRKKTGGTESILNTLKAGNLVNDMEFARKWVESRRMLKPVSRRKLRYELAAKRVAPDVIDSVLSVNSEEYDEIAVLRELVKRKISKYPDRQKFMRYLAGQGFNYEDIKSVLSENIG